MRRTPRAPKTRSRLAPVGLAMLGAQIFGSAGWVGRGYFEGLIQKEEAPQEDKDPTLVKCRTELQADLQRVAACMEDRDPACEGLIQVMENPKNPESIDVARAMQGIPDLACSRELGDDDAYAHTGGPWLVATDNLQGPSRFPTEGTVVAFRADFEDLNDCQTAVKLVLAGFGAQKAEAGGIDLVLKAADGGWFIPGNPLNPLAQKAEGQGVTVEPLSSPGRWVEAANDYCSGAGKDLRAPKLETSQLPLEFLGNSTQQPKSE